MTVGLLSTGKPLIVCVSCELGPRDTQGGSAGSGYRLRGPRVPTGCHQLMHSFSSDRMSLRPAFHSGSAGGLMKPQLVCPIDGPRNAQSEAAGKGLLDNLALSSARAPARSSHQLNLLKIPWTSLVLTHCTAHRHETVPVDARAWRRSLGLRSHFRRPSKPMGEAWFMGDGRQMFPQLLGDLGRLSTEELQEFLAEIASGTTRFLHCGSARGPFALR